MFKQLLTSSLLLASAHVWANNPIDLEAQADKTITQLYHSQLIKSKSDCSSRIDAISAQFLGQPYLLTALGEGKQGYFDNAPLYRVDAFDCETYVDTVLALAMGHDTISFKRYIRQVRYKEGKVGFLHRNHFTCLDWNQNNQKQGFLKDITTSFHDQHGKPIAKIAQALINKSAWHQHLSPNIIRIQTPSTLQQTKRLAELKRRGNLLPNAIARIPYIPLTALFDPAGAPNMHLFNQIPNGAIIEIVRPNWDLEQQIGTHLNVSHLGFAILKNGRLMFRNASSLKHQVTDVPLIDYLREAQNSPTTEGINVQILIKKYPR